MTARVEVDDSWRENVSSAMDELFDTRLGPDIAGDARRYCPKRTGSLAASVEHHVEGGTLIVSAKGSDAKEYAAYVELGTRAHVITARPGSALYWLGARHPVRRVTIPDIPAQPFLRPALYQRRGD